MKTRYKNLPLQMWRTDPQQLRSGFMAAAVAITILSCVIGIVVVRETQLASHWVLLLGLPSLALGLGSLWVIYMVLLNFVVLQRREARLRRVARLGYWRYQVANTNFEASADVWLTQGVSDPREHSLARFLSGFKLQEDRDRFMQNLAEVTATGGTFEMEAPFVTRMGHAVWIAVVGKSYQSPAEVLSVEGSIQNVTQRKEAELAKAATDAYLRDVVNFAQIGLWEYDILQGKRRVNRYFFDMVGWAWPGGEGLIDIDMEDLFHPDDLPVVLHERQRVVDKVCTAYSMNARVRHAQGHWVWIYSCGSVGAINEAGAVTHLRGVSINITPIQEARQAAEEANRAKAAFLSRMSHELRTPINTMLGYTQMLRMEGGTTARQEDHITNVLSGGRHLLNLVNDLLHLNVVKPGEVMPQRLLQPTALTDVVATSLRMLEPQAGERHITLNQDLRDGQWVKADPLRLQQVVINLLTNAIKYGFEGSQVFLSSRLLGSGLLRLSVRDQGQGIAPSVGERVFEPFYRGTLPDFGYEGAGIGLTVCKQLMEGMNGHISYESTVGVGSVFHIDLPVTTAPAASA